jgi:hypothetical protein
MKIKEVLKSIFSSDQSLSSKRVFGAIGFIASVIIIWTIKPEFVDYLLTVSASLLGLETITRIFKKNESNKEL